MRRTRVHWVPLASLDHARPALFVFAADWSELSKNLDDVLEEESVVEALDRVQAVRVVDRKHEEGANPPEVQALQDRYEVTSLPTVVFQPTDERKPRVLRGFQQGSVVIELIENGLGATPP